MVIDRKGRPNSCADRAKIQSRTMITGAHPEIKDEDEASSYLSISARSPQGLQAALNLNVRADKSDRAEIVHTAKPGPEGAGDHFQINTG
jgi:hypothetical protein